MLTLNYLKEDKTIILFSSIILFLSVFLWDFKFMLFQAKYLISILLLYNFILFKKIDLKYYLYFLGFCLLLFAHLVLVNRNFIFEKYIIFSIIYFFIFGCSL